MPSSQKPRPDLPTFEVLPTVEDLLEGRYPKLLENWADYAPTFARFIGHTPENEEV